MKKFGIVLIGLFLLTNSVAVQTEEVDIDDNIYESVEQEAEVTLSLLVREKWLQELAVTIFPQIRRAGLGQRLPAIHLRVIDWIYQKPFESTELLFTLFEQHSDLMGDKTIFYNLLGNYFHALNNVKFEQDCLVSNEGYRMIVKYADADYENRGFQNNRLATAVGYPFSDNSWESYQVTIQKFLFRRGELLSQLFAYHMITYLDKNAAQDPVASALLKTYGPSLERKYNLFAGRWNEARLPEDFHTQIGTTEDFRSIDYVAVHRSHPAMPFLELKINEKTKDNGVPYKPKLPSKNFDQKDEWGDSKIYVNTSAIKKIPLLGLTTITPLEGDTRETGGHSIDPVLTLDDDIPAENNGSFLPLPTKDQIQSWSKYILDNYLENQSPFTFGGAKRKHLILPVLKIQKAGIVKLRPKGKKVGLVQYKIDSLSILADEDKRFHGGDIKAFDEIRILELDKKDFPTGIFYNPNHDLRSFAKYSIERVTKMEDVPGLSVLTIVGGYGGLSLSRVSQVESGDFKEEQFSLGGD